MSEAIARLSTALTDRYIIERELGAGGMATVYLAHDVRHDRKVALKVLRPELATILGGERFLAEIKTTANLQHPHILPLHDSGEVGGLVFYVMPYVEGESLRDRLTREQQLPVEDAVRIACEVADALEYAHQHGIVHRDIKPENILLHGGHAMVADFGIALAASRSEGGTRMTETGMSLGTPHYMSPEQAMGEREITPKADIYALGCVLYEMLLGEPPFTGPTAQAIVAKVMTVDAPGVAAQRHTVPPHVDAAVLQALAKLPADRFNSAAAFARALGDPGFTGATSAYRTATARGVRPRLSPVLLAAVGLAGVAIGLGVAWVGHRTMSPSREVRFYLTSDSARTLTGTFALSPDGTILVYRAITPSGPLLFQQRLSELEPRPIPGTADAADNPVGIFFSPDGTTIGFYTGSALKRVRLDGADLTTVVRATEGWWGASWGVDGSIVYFTDHPGRLYRVGAQGGAPADVTVRGAWGETLLNSPRHLPDGRRVLCAAVVNGLSRIGVLDLATGDVTPLLEGLSPSYVEPGFLLYGTFDGSLMRQPFDAGRADTTGPAERFADNIATFWSAIGSFAAAPTGTVVMLPRVTGGATLRLLRRDGGSTILARGERFWVPRFSPNGRLVVFGAYVASSVWADLWSYDVLLGNAQPLTSGGVGGRDFNDGVWSPDGSRLVLSAVDSAVSAGKNLYVRPGEGGGPPVLLLDRPGDQWPTDWTRDGTQVLFTDVPVNGRQAIWITPTAGAIEPRPVVQTSANAAGGRLSPDGRWLAYESDETGQREVYLQPFPGPGRRLRVSVAGGMMPSWSRRGTELLYYQAARRRIEALSVGAGPDPVIGAPHVMFEVVLEAGALALYDVHPDGQRAVAAVGAEPSDRYVVVTDVRLSRGR